MTEWQRALRWMQRRVAARDDAMRVDRWLRQQFPHIPQSFLHKQLRQRKIRVLSPAGDASVPAKPHAILRSGTVVAIDTVVFERGFGGGEEGLMVEEKEEEEEDAMTADVRDVVDRLVQRVVYTDDNFLVLNKPHGLAVQDGTALDSSLAAYLPGLGAAFQSEPPRLVHRLDKETSGLLVLARHRLAAAKFSEVLRDGLVKKTYDALVWPLRQADEIPAQGEISLPIDGKPARTVFSRLARACYRGDGSLWLEMQPVTGRKHQLRLHCAVGLKAPIVGDLRHGPRAAAQREDRLHLHAKRLQFPDPFRARRSIDVCCEMDSDKADAPKAWPAKTNRPKHRRL